MCWLACVELMFVTGSQPAVDVFVVNQAHTVTGSQPAVDIFVVGVVESVNQAQTVKVMMMFSAAVHHPSSGCTCRGCERIEACRRHHHF